MARKFLSPIDMNKLEILQPRAHQSSGAPSTPVEGQWWWDTATHLMMWQNNSTAINPLARGNHSGTQLAATISDFATTVVLSRLDQMAVPTTSVNLNSQKITGLATPTASTDAATKGYVDTAVSGLSWKQAVRAASTANGTLATAFVNGAVLDGVSLVTGDRILLKNQTAGAENGIRIVAASGAPARATDADVAAELLGAAVMVQEGTTLANTQWIQTVDATITVDTTALVFTQFGAGSSYTNGNGMALAGNSFSVLADPTPADIIVGAAGVKTDPAKVTHNYVSATIGDGSTTSIVVTHNLGTRAVQVRVHLTASTYDEVEVECQHTSVNTVTLIFAVAPTTNQYTVTIEG